MHEILPGILEKEWSGVENKFSLVRPFARSIHVDLLDGKFVPNTSFLDPKPFAPFAKDFLLELHMMVEEPIQYLQAFADAGFRRFIGHVEKMSDQVAFVAAGEQLGEVGLGLDLDTTIDAVRVPYQSLDTLLVMTVKAGFSGQSFVPQALTKVRDVHEKHAFLPIIVDGGINDSTILEVASCGASRFVATSYLFSSDTPQVQFETLLARVAS